MARRARPERLGTGVRRCRPARRSGDPVAQRRHARPRGARAGVRLGPVASVAVAGRSRPGDPGRRRGRLCRGLRPRDGAVVGPPARGLRLALAVDRIGQGPVHPRHRRVEQHHHPGRRWTISSAWASDRSSSPASADSSRRSMIYITLVAGVRARAVHGHRRPGRGDGPSTSGRSSCTRPPLRLLRDRLRGPRPGRDVHPLGGRARAVQLHPRARGHRAWRRAGSPRDAGAGTRAAATRIFSAAAVGFAVVCATAGALVVHGVWTARAETCRPSRAALDAAGATPDGSGHVDRRVGHGVLDGPRRASSSSTTRSTPSSRSRARTTSTGSCSMPTTASTRSAPDPRRAPSGRRGSGDRVDGPDGGIPVRLAVYPLRRPGRSHDPARGLPLRARGLRRRARRQGDRRVPMIVFPKPEDTAYYVGVARNLVEGHGLVSQRALELPDAAARVPAAGLRGLAAAADLPRRDPDGDPRARRSHAAQVVVRPRRRDRPGPRLAARRRRRRGARHCPPGGRGRSRSGPGSRARSTCRSSSTRPCPTRRCRSPSSRSAPAC